MLSSSSVEEEIFPQILEENENEAKAKSEGKNSILTSIPDKDEQKETLQDPRLIHFNKFIESLLK